MSKGFLSQTSALSWFLIALGIMGSTGCKNGCRGATTEEAPIHIQRNMFSQDKGKPQRENLFFADHRVMRPEVPGTVPANAPMNPSDPYLTGLTSEASIETRMVTPGAKPADAPAFLEHAPVPITGELLHRGQERYNIYCAPCHGLTGHGDGTVPTQAKKGGFFWSVTSYHDERILDRKQTPDGRLFHVITNGLGTMPSYASQIPVEDRWAIVAYIRALQRSQRANVTDVPASERSQLQ